MVLALEKGGKAGSPSFKKALAIEAEAAEVIERHRRDALELGAPAVLLAAGELEEALPLDDAVALEGANPVTPGGKVRLDPAKLRARQEAIVRGLAAQGVPCAVIVLGGAHDLSGSVRRLAPGCEYLRVTLKSYPREGGRER